MQRRKERPLCIDGMPLTLVHWLAVKGDANGASACARCTAGADNEQGLTSCSRSARRVSLCSTRRTRRATAPQSATLTPRHRRRCASVAPATSHTSETARTAIASLVAAPSPSVVTCPSKCASMSVLNAGPCSVRYGNRRIAARSADNALGEPALVARGHAALPRTGDGQDSMALLTSRSILSSYTRGISGSAGCAGSP